MSTNRVYFFSFILVSLLSFFSSAALEFSPTDISHAQEWSALCAQQMTPQELQLTANFLFLLYANAFIDSEIQKYFSPFSHLSQAVRINLSDPDVPNNELAQLKALIEKLSYLTKVRYVYTKMLISCLDHYNANKIDTVEQALKALQLHASELLYRWADGNNQNFTAQLEKSSQIMAETAQSIHLAHNFHKALHDGMTPFIVEEHDKPVAIINAVLKSAPTFMHAADNTINALNDVCHHAMETISLGAAIYKQHYQALYEIIAADSFDKNYAITLFDTMGLLPQAYTSLLPDADHVFEHMLETTHLFIQITNQ